MEDLTKIELRHLRMQTAINIYNEDNAVLEKIDDSIYAPQSARDEKRVELLKEILTSDPVIKTILNFLTAAQNDMQTDSQAPMIFSGPPKDLERLATSEALDSRKTFPQISPEALGSSPFNKSPNGSMKSCAENGSKEEK